MIRRFSSSSFLRGGASSIALLTILSGAVQAQEEVAEVHSAVDGVDYRVYDRHGNASSLLGIIGATTNSDVLLVGEEHDDMVGHAFEAALLETAAEEHVRPIVLSLEMFERDVQYVLDEYLDGLISEEHFLKSSRPWDDYETRYRPLVEVAKMRHAPVVAANAPRRYVNRVTRDGRESLAALSTLAKSYLPPLPYPGPSELYRSQWDAAMTEAMAAGPTDSPVEVEADAPVEVEADAPTEIEADIASDRPDHSMSADAIYSQALWDASMGHAITTALVENLGALVVHFAGAFHVERGTGIVERIEDYRPGTRVTTVVMTKVEDIDMWSEEEHAELADFVVLTRKPADASATEGS